MNTNNNCMIAQSGGPTVAINASLAGIIKEAINNNAIGTVYGAINGVKGLMEDRLLNLSDIFGGNDELLNKLTLTPAMYLGSCRYRLKTPDVDSTDYELVFNIFKKYDIKYFLYIGGNDSMDTVAKLSDYAKKINYDINIMGVPKTIDNDLACTDHTPGFGSAAKYIATSILEIAHDAYIYNVESVTIVEIMGRNVGWLTGAAALARNSYSEAPHLIYLPERAFDKDEFIASVKELLGKRKHVIVAISEGIHDDKGNYISASSDNVDQFGHVALSGAGKYLENLVAKEIGCKVRSVELNVLQRCATHISSGTDISESFEIGRYALKQTVEGQTGKMVTINRISSSPYEYELGTKSIHDIANVEKGVPLEWINAEGNDVLEEFYDYARPLIEGENFNLGYYGGIPSYMDVSHLYGLKNNKQI